jgi:hypothetical protein
VNPYARFSASVALTLAIWGPHAVSSIRNNHVDLGHSASRFLVIFLASRFAMRWISMLLWRYREASRFSIENAIDAGPTSSAGAGTSANPLAGSVDRRRSTVGRAADGPPAGANVIDATNGVESA